MIIEGDPKEMEAMEQFDRYPLEKAQKLHKQNNPICSKYCAAGRGKQKFSHGYLDRVLFADDTYEYTAMWRNWSGSTCGHRSVY